MDLVLPLAAVAIGCVFLDGAGAMALGRMVLEAGIALGFGGGEAEGRATGDKEEDVDDVDEGEEDDGGADESGSDPDKGDSGPPARRAGSRGLGGDVERGVVAAETVVEVAVAVVVVVITGALGSLSNPERFVAEAPAILALASAMG